MEKKKWSFLKGLTLGLLATTAVSYATYLTKSHTFSSGQSISSSQVNENFDELYALVNELAKKSINGLSSNQTITCSASAVTKVKVNFDTPIQADTNFNPATSEYTFTEDGHYTIMASIPTVADYWDSIYVYKNGVNYEFITSASPKTLYFSAGDVADIRASCKDKTYADVTADSSKSFFFVKKF